MSYLPNMPGVPAPMSYGQDFGNWQKYAGFNAQNPFGTMPGIAPAPKIASTAPVLPTAPVAMQPAAPTGQFGSQPMASFGSAPEGQFGSIEDAVAADEHKY